MCFTGRGLRTDDWAEETALNFLLLEVQRAYNRIIQVSGDFMSEIQGLTFVSFPVINVIWTEVRFSAVTEPRIFEI